jgi:hypothetical protein
MDKDKAKQEISVIGRLFSIETLLFLMGIASLVSGIVTGEAIQLFWGGLILTGTVALHFVRKKDWKKHWEEQEQFKQLYEQRERERKDKDAAGKS